MPLLRLGDDLLCRLFANRVLDGRSVCKSIKASLYKSGSRLDPLRLHVVARVDNWHAFSLFSHIVLYVSSDDELEQCRMAGVNAVRVVGCGDIDEAIRLDLVGSRPINRHIWALADAVADKERPLPRYIVLHRLIDEISNCQSVRILVQYWLCRRLMACSDRHDILTLGLRLRVMFRHCSSVHSILTLRDLVSESMLNMIMANFSSSHLLSCHTQTIIDVFTYAPEIMVSEDMLINSGCINVVINIASGYLDELPDAHSRHTWNRDMRHTALMALSHFLKKCTAEDAVVDTLLGAGIVRVTQQAACSRDFYFATPAYLVFYEMCMIDKMCAAMFEINVQVVLAWMCRNNIPQALFVLSQMLIHVSSNSETHNNDPDARSRFWRLYIDTVQWLRNNNYSLRFQI